MVEPVVVQLPEIDDPEFGIWQPELWPTDDPYEREAFIRIKAVFYARYAEMFIVPIFPQISYCRLYDPGQADRTWGFMPGIVATKPEKPFDWKAFQDGKLARHMIRAYELPSGGAVMTPYWQWGLAEAWERGCTEP